jgi:hypothetical protein
LGCNDRAGSYLGAKNAVPFYSRVYITHGLWITGGLREFNWPATLFTVKIVFLMQKQTPDMNSKIFIFIIWGSHSGGYEEFYLLEYTVVHCVE